MKHIYLKYLLLFSITLLINACKTHKQLFENEDGMRQAIAQEMLMTRNPITLKVEREKLIPALAYTNELLSKKTRAAIANVNWTELGPKNEAGRARGMMADLADPTGKTVWVGSVSGGLWKTIDITQTPTNWIQNTSMINNLAITGIVQDPTNINIMYLCTGEAIGNSDAVTGLGVFKSTNSGATWTQLSATANTNFEFCHRIIIAKNGNILVATKNAGLQMSNDGGNTFTKTLGTGLSITGASTDNCYDVKIAANGAVFASLDGSLHKSTNNAVTFSNAISLPISASRIEIACAKSDSNYVYLAVELFDAVKGLLKSTNGGTSFASITMPVDADTGIPTTDFSRNQAWYNLAIAVDPNNKDNVMVGGIDVFKSTNAGSSWTQLSHWYGGFGFPELHSDVHLFYYSPTFANTCYVLCDGGIYELNNISTATPGLVNKENNLNTIQLYSCAMHPAAYANYFLAGAQDNGSHVFTQDVLQNAIEVSGGDGSLCHIDQNEPKYQITSFVYNQYSISRDSGATFNNVSQGNTGQFINPTDLDDNANILYCGFDGGKYLRWDNPQTGNTFTPVTVAAFGSAKVSCIKVSPNVANRVYFGLDNGAIIRVNNANTAAPIATNIKAAAMPSSWVSSIEIEAGNENHILTTNSGYGVNSIWESTDGGTTFASAENNVPDMPVRWIILNPGNASQALIATELGVWSTDNLNGSATIWGPSNSSMNNVRTDMLQTRASDKVVIAATHGRGLFLSDVFANAKAKFSANETVVYPYQNIQFSNTSYKANSSTWYFGDGTTSTLTNPTKKYTSPGVYTVKLVINGNVDSVIKTNYITVLSREALPFTYAQGGNFDVNTSKFAPRTIAGTPWVLGNSSTPGKSGTVSGTNAWLTGLNGNYLDNTESYLYSPQFNFSTVAFYALNFQTQFETEFEYDGFIVESSIDTGKTWIPLGNTVSPTWYNYSNNPQVSIVFPFNQAFFNDNTSNIYGPKSYNISAFAGKPSVAFRFAFKSDPFSTAAGVAIDNFQIQGPSLSPLAINVLNFNALANGINAQLSWQTCCEEKVSKYILQRNTNASDFEDIYEVTSQLLPENNYAFMDKNILENNASVNYRIKIVAVNNEVSYSNTLTLKANNNAQGISIMPNPVSNSFTITTSLKLKSAQMIDANGKVVFKTNQTKGTILIPENIHAGTYILRLETNTGLVDRKIIKEN
jgi:PKD repeat protein